MFAGAQGAEKRFLRWTGPLGRRVLRFDGLAGRGLWYRPSGDNYEVSVTGLAFYIIWHDKHSADWLAALASPYPASPDFPLFRGQNKTPRNTLFINGSTVSTGYSATACGGKVVAPATKGGMHFRRPQGGYEVFAAKGGIKMAPKAPYLASAAILYNSRGREPSTRPGGVSRSRTEPLAPRAKGPAAPSTLARERPRSAD